MKYKSLNDQRPDLAKLWHPTKNVTLSIDHVSQSSEKKAWWQCEKGHEWEQQICARSRSIYKCPFCSNRKPCKDNSLATLYPEIAKQWHPTKNPSLQPDNVLPKSTKKAWWICKRGHEWEQQINTRVRSNIECLYCSELKACFDNSLAKIFPEIAKEWHPIKNESLTPMEVMPGTVKKVWWVCKNGHEVNQSVKSRTSSKYKCLLCTKMKVYKDNNLANLYPDVANNWHKIKNNSLSPDQVTPKSTKSVWWRCERGHEWQQRINARVKSELDCPCCSGRKVCNDNSLAKLYPEIAKQWHPTKNGELKPNQFVAGSKARIWWKCESGHEWEQRIIKRVRCVYICRTCGWKKICAIQSLSKTYPDIAKKWDFTKNLGLIPSQVAYNSPKKVWWTCKNGHVWLESIRNRVKSGNNCPKCVDENNLRSSSLYEAYPKLAEEWHPSKNGCLKPIEILATSKKKAWWLCQKGHEWRQQVNIRTEQLNKCQACNKSEKTNEETVTEINPDIIKFLHPAKNGAIDMQKQCANLNSTLWWRCERGHEWQKKVKHFLNAKAKCPYCSNREICDDNRLSTKFPDIAKLWHFKNNGDLSPSQVVFGARKRVWWKCKNGHEWQDSVYNMTRNNRVCPECRKQSSSNLVVG